MVSIPEEPSSDMRLLARSIRDIYAALLAENFTEYQALVIVGQVLIAARQGGAS